MGVCLGNLYKTLLAVCFVSICSNSQAESQCDNFLKVLKKLPAHLEFVKCEKIHEAQTEKLQATYRVLGIHAASVERHLMLTASMPGLRFVCCAWEPWPNHLKLSRRGFYKNKNSYDYEVTMYTEETLIDSREKWREIYYFWVTVALPLEAPPP